ncbi:unnamed protein product [Rotaria socialis]|uniref:Uncharacterized protein n=1 Tax=Rotaria socialis TaxID=392032 RepID=A0A819WA52_9BILA|nr:unnamed protein product [Rotaria socialis]CAF3373590.1 unnamed protein product [Rotaria socialis]CAF3413664.1 unnamed protein product [Rotaria socialis]CAF3775961.1 unnamed protein product [Rotaria socialis]CAF4111826.1 unnamed protein product [Rotaria socialis]
MGGSSSINTPVEPRKNSTALREPVSEAKKKIQKQEQSTNDLRRQEMQAEQQQQKLEKPLNWPLPKREKEKDFVVNSLPMNKRYTVSENQYNYNEAIVQRSIKATTVNFRPTQKTMTKTTDDGDSNVHESARAQLIMQAKTDLWAGISSSAEMQNLLASLNVTHMESSEIIQQRLHGLSREAERVMGLIINDTIDEQNRLLEYAQEIQARQEELHREWLQKYLLELDRWRSHELEQLHEKIDGYKETINLVAYKKLAFVNQQVKSAKSYIFQDEYNRQTEKADRIVSDMEKLSRQHDMQQFGTEAKTDIHLKIQGNGGNKPMNEKAPFYDPFVLKREYVNQRMLTDQ